MLLPYLHTAKKRSVSFIRTISLTLPSLSTNQVVKAITPDIIAGTVDGLDFCDIDRENVLVFIDVCGTLAGYPASSEVLHV